MTTALVYGAAVASAATARALHARGYRVIVADDNPTDERRRLAQELGGELVVSPDADAIAALVASVDLVAPAPGVPETHPVVSAALSLATPLSTELDLAYEWEQERAGGPRPMLAITGTDGKTTTTMLTGSLLRAAGHRVVEAGNTELPLVAAIDDDTTDVFAVECSSFRLSWLRSFRAEGAIWLNIAPDHQNWHRSMESYEAAKANVWAHQRADDVAVAWVDDHTVLRRLAASVGRPVTFGLRDGDYHLVGGGGDGPLLCNGGGPFAHASSLARRFPHDLTNALAACAASIETGLVAEGDVDRGLASFTFPPHRIEPLGEHDGVSWYNDSKATTPHAALTAIRAFDSLVLIAGGRNKGLDLRSLASEPQRMRAVVAIGEAADEIAGVFDGVCPVRRATSMEEAVVEAAALAVAGDVVLLSPACASFDWYPDGGYPARGDDFRRHVAALTPTPHTATPHTPTPHTIDRAPTR
jgi:UDP-N-acetylmuramoylalanine--D-glutamate ligase